MREGHEETSAKGTFSPMMNKLVSGPFLIFWLEATRQLRAVFFCY